jgi:hypothetical protein
MWLDASNHLEDLASLNAAHVDRQIQPVAGTGSTMLVNADLLADCEHGGYWQEYASLLLSMPRTDEQRITIPADRPQEQ